MKKLKQLFDQYREQILYVIFGGMTTVINLIASYMFKALGMSAELATAAAWLPSVLFAFVTNKIWVFQSKSANKNRLIYEIGTFLLSRAATGLLDVGLMHIAGIIWQDDAFMLMRIASNILVIILNYLAGKLITFKNKK